MKIDELVDIVKEHSVRYKWQWHYDIGGCEVLEHIVDVEGFVLLLRRFWKLGVDISFVDNYPDPIGTILGGGVTFSYHKFGNCVRVVIDYDSDKRSYWYKTFYEEGLYDD